MAAKTASLQAVGSTSATPAPAPQDASLRSVSHTADAGTGSSGGMAPSPDLLTSAQPAASERRPDMLDAQCKWMDLWHPSFKAVRPVARRRLEVPEDTDRQPQILCCKLTDRDALCKVWKSAQHVVPGASGVQLVGASAEQSDPWLDQYISVAEHHSMKGHDDPLVRLDVAIHRDDVSISLVSGDCPRRCAEKCQHAELEAQRACEGIGRYRSFSGHWERQKP